MKKSKLLIGIGVIAAVAIMVVNLQYAYSDYGILSNNLHSEVLAQNQCAEIQDRINELSNRIKYYTDRNDYSPQCLSLLDQRNNLYKKLDECILNPGSGSGGGTSTGGTGTSNPAIWDLIYEDCRIVTNGVVTIKKKVGDCRTGGNLYICSRTECTL